MTAFEIVFSLLSMITSLALAHLLNGFVILLRHVERIRISMLHGLWSWIALAVLIGNWASFWQMREVESWPAWSVLLILAAAIFEYAFCALVTPEMPGEGELDLHEFHDRQHHLYMFALIALLITSLILNIGLGGWQMYENWWHDSILTIAGLLLSTMAIFIKKTWVQAGASFLIAMIVTYYLVVTCNLILI
ncbi:MAG: hypothetical protein R2787_17250 [Saprospiraceae bacterium]